MATTKLWKVENRLDNVVNYASDKSKTENKKYRTTTILYMKENKILITIAHNINVHIQVLYRAQILHFGRHIHRLCIALGLMD